MREWNLREGDPLSLFLAADARSCVTDYADDQIWELALQGGDPPALAVESLLGLRAVSLRIFPVFVIGHSPVSNPLEFTAPPTVFRFAPNYLHICAEPVSQLAADLEYWVPQSHALTGRVRICNHGAAVIGGECWMAGVLRPAGSGTPFHPESAGRVAGMFLLGKAGNLAPILLIKDGTGVGRAAYPALKSAFEIRPGESHEMRWAFCGLPSFENGLTLARGILDLPWEASIARVEMDSAAFMDIETGRPDWDAVLAFSQVTAVQSIVAPVPHSERPAPVIGRTPDRGYSLRGDGSDYPPSWSGLNPLELLPLLSILAVVNPDLAKGLIRHYAESADADNLPDSRPGLARQRAGGLCPPILLQAAWRVLSGRSDFSFVDEIASVVERQLDAWFDFSHDKDQDGVPEWDRMDALGPDVPPLWSRNDIWGGWVHPADVESPSLQALLYGECCAMERLYLQREMPEKARRWKDRAHTVQRALERMQPGDAFLTVDRETHTSTNGKVLWEGKAGSVIRLNESLEPPARVAVRCMGAAGTRPLVKVLITGTDAGGRKCEETLQGENFFWLQGSGSACTHAAWKKIQSFLVQGPAGEITYRVDVSELRREDLTMYLPLWCRAVTADRASKALFRLEQESLYTNEAGLAFVPKTDPGATVVGEGSPRQVWMLWNSLLTEAAIRYERGDLAWKWMERWLRILVGSLRQDRAFRSSYQPDGSRGSGPRNSLRGIFPVGVLLTAAGVIPLSATSVWIGKRSVLPFRVTIRYKGLTVVREGDTADIEYPSGNRRSVNGEALVCMEDLSRA